jgi:outer membrane protein assembly factor BamD
MGFKTYFCAMFFNRHRHILFFAIGFAWLMSACTGYNKLLKSSDLELKYSKTIELYEKKKYYKAYPLLEELVTVYRGTARAEKLAYMYAYTDYYLGDYLLAGHRFDQFAKTYPTSKFREEMQFMSAYCSYVLSPNYSLDQEFTIKAMNELQLFLNDYPNSERRDTCNILVEELEHKLEEKAFEASKQYLKMEDYKSASVTFEILLEDYPDTEYREEGYFLRFRTRYHLARKSVEDKKLERIDSALKAYITFVDRFPESEYIGDAEELYDQLLRMKENLQANNN